MISGKDPEDLTPGERRAFNKLKRLKAPPQSLEEKTVKALHAMNLLTPDNAVRKSFASWTLPRLGTAVVAASLIFLLGFTVGRQHDQQDSAVPSQSLFALLIYDDDKYVGDPMVQGQEYGNWMLEVKGAGRYATGQEFLPSGRILRAGADQIEVRDLAAAESYGAIGGFILIEASSYEEAVRLASSCPHLKYKGTIEVREIH